MASSSSTEPAESTVTTTTTTESVPSAGITTSTESAPTTAEKITLKTADGSIFEVEKSVAMELATVKSYFDEGSSNDTVVPLPNVLAKALSHVIAYCKRQVEFRSGSVPEEEKKKYKVDFVKDKNNEEIKELILASNYLDVKDLLDVLCQAVADRIKNKSVEYVRTFFGIDNDYTPEEEARLRQENAWSFEGVDDDEE